jgi:hypothetical protein
MPVSSTTKEAPRRSASPVPREDPELASSAPPAMNAFERLRHETDAFAAVGRAHLGPKILPRESDSGVSPPSPLRYATPSVNSERSADLHSQPEFLTDGAATETSPTAVDAAWQQFVTRLRETRQGDGGHTHGGRNAAFLVPPAAALLNDMFDDMDAPSAALLGAQKHLAASPVSRSSCSACSPGTRFGADALPTRTQRTTKTTLSTSSSRTGSSPGEGDELDLLNPGAVSPAAPKPRVDPRLGTAGAVLGSDAHAVTIAEFAGASERIHVLHRLAFEQREGKLRRATQAAALVDPRLEHAAVCIQALVRGVLTRRNCQRWLENRLRAVAERAADASSARDRNAVADALLGFVRCETRLRHARAASFVASEAVQRRQAEEERGRVLAAKRQEADLRYDADLRNFTEAMRRHNNVLRLAKKQAAMDDFLARRKPPPAPAPVPELNLRSPRKHFVQAVKLSPKVTANGLAEIDSHPWVMRAASPPRPPASRPHVGGGGSGSPLGGQHHDRFCEQAVAALSAGTGLTSAKQRQWHATHTAAVLKRWQKEGLDRYA